MSILNIIHNEIKKNSQNKRFIIVGIDGPTASGKTFFAKKLKKYLEKKKFNTWIFELDWTLKNREYRKKYLKNIFKDNISFEFEAEEHMNLDVPADFISKINDFNKKGTTNVFKTKLKDLYDRNNDGKCTKV